jgi:DNA-binding MarR family transcriptional regulator
MPSTVTALHALDDALTRLRRVWLHPRRRRRFLTELGTPIELALLRTLRAIDTAETDEPGVCDVATELAVDASTSSRLVEQAVSAGYVERTPSATDRRRTVLSLSPQGVALLARATDVRERLLGEVTAEWAPEDVATLARLLTRLHRDFERLDG